jgi:hypothetical protein
LLLHHPAHHRQHQHLHHRASELIENIQDFHRRRTAELHNNMLHDMQD